MKSMNLEKVSQLMDRFEQSFENLDVQSQVMEGTMCNTSTLTTPQGEVDSLMQEVADEAGLELNMDLPSAQGSAIGSTAQTQASQEQVRYEFRGTLPRIQDCVISNGGVKPNIIPAVSELVYYLRAPTPPELAMLNAKVIGCIEGAAKATGCQVEYKFDPKPYSSLMSNDIMASLYAENAEKVGVKIERDPENLRKAGGSTDMGNVAHEVPSIHPKFHIGTMASQHTPEFATQASVISNGGVKPNIVPALSELVYYLRAPTPTELAVLNEKVIGCIEGAAKATGCQVEYKFDPKGYSSLLSNGVMASLYAENAEKVGVVIEKDPEKLKRAGGSTDMGNVSHVVPSIHPKYHITMASAHTPDFATCARTPEAEDNSLAVAKALAMTAIDFLTTPQLVQQAKVEFAAAIEAEKSILVN
nr:hypothetical protein BaRGS_007615 [Batillaria attramentaria]